MQASNVSCDVIFGLLGRWHDGDMAEHDRDAYEQHLLFCPPCLQQNDKLRLALAALGQAARDEPDPQIHVRLRSLPHVES